MRDFSPFWIVCLFLRGRSVTRRTSGTTSVFSTGRLSRESGAEDGEGGLWRKGGGVATILWVSWRRVCCARVKQDREGEGEGSGTANSSLLKHPHADIRYFRGGGSKKNAHPRIHFGGRASCTVASSEPAAHGSQRVSISVEMGGAGGRVWHELAPSHMVEMCPK